MRAEARRGTCAARGAVHTCRQVHTSFRGSAGAARPARQDARLLLRAAAVPRLRARDGGKLGVGRGAALPAGEGRGVRGGAGRGGARGIRNACSKYSRHSCLLCIGWRGALKRALGLQVVQDGGRAHGIHPARRPPPPGAQRAGCLGGTSTFFAEQPQQRVCHIHLSGLCHAGERGGAPYPASQQSRKGGRGAVAYYSGEVYLTLPYLIAGPATIGGAGRRRAASPLSLGAVRGRRHGGSLSLFPLISLILFLVRLKTTNLHQ